MRIVVLGAGGMLGAAVVSELLKVPYEVIPIYDHIYYSAPLAKLRNQQFDMVINCAGAVPNKYNNYVYMGLVNSIVPHKLAIDTRQHKQPIIHFSTDCVFSGRNPKPVYHTTDELPQPESVYARSKLLGEVRASNVMNVRTSFIGLRHGLLSSLLSARGTTMNGWTLAFWSGSYVTTVAKAIVEKLVPGFVGGIIHLATPNAMSKYDTIKTLSDGLGLDIRLNADTDMMIDRSLKATIELPTLSSQLDVIKYDLGISRADPAPPPVQPEAVEVA